VRFYRTGVKRILHPVVGGVRLNYEARSSRPTAPTTPATVADNGLPTYHLATSGHPRRRVNKGATMEHRSLGRTGVSVSKLCLGAMMFGEWGTKDHDESIRIIHRALDAGINFIDTADVYSAGESEVIVGKALAGGKRDNVVLASKVHMPMGDDPNRRGNSRRWIITEVETRCGDSRPTGSTSIRSIARIPRPISTRRSER